MDHVSVLHLVGLALLPQDPGLPRLGETAGCDQLLVPHNLGPYETALYVAVDLAGRLDRRRVPLDRPGPALVLADREERDQVEQPVGEPDDPAEAELLDPEVGHELASLRLIELAQLHLEPPG